MKYDPIRISHYLGLIQIHYGRRTANRSGLPYINHILEGIYILNYIDASENAICAYIVHPLFQADDKLLVVDLDQIEPEIVLLCMEYRSVANEYLPKRDISKIGEIRLSPLEDVNNMLIADKIQNYKDFKTNKEKYVNADRLQVYFENWLVKLQEYYNVCRKCCPR